MTDPQKPGISESQTLRAMGLDALADVPKGLRKQFTPGAVITLAITVSGAVWTCAIFYADARASHQHETELQQERTADHALLEKIDKNQSVMQATFDLRLKTLEGEAGEQKSFRARQEGVWSVPTKQVKTTKK